MRGKTSLGVAAGAMLAFCLANEVRRRQVSTRIWTQKRPGTALITGASSGIGAAFARVLASEGYDVVLLARRRDRLQSLADEIQRESPVRVEIWVADLNNPADVEEVEQHIAGLADLDLLINNAGFGLVGLFSEQKIEDSLRMTQVHIIASMRLARAALPAMIARRHGGIINVSSIAALVPVGKNTIYGATKSYLNFFSESLQLELEGSGVRLQALCPGFTYTEFHNEIGRPNLRSLFWMQPEQVVRESLRGLREKQLYVIPGRLNQILAAAIKFPLAAPVVRWARARVMRKLPAR